MPPYRADSTTATSSSGVGAGSASPYLDSSSCAPSSTTVTAGPTQSALLVIGRPAAKDGARVSRRRSTKPRVQPATSRATGRFGPDPGQTSNGKLEKEIE